MIALYILIAGCAVGACLSFRMSQWFRQEGDFWEQEAINLRPENMVASSELLKWTKENPTPLLQKLRGWKSPPERRIAQHV